MNLWRVYTVWRDGDEKGAVKETGRTALEAARAAAPFLQNWFSAPDLLAVTVEDDKGERVGFVLDQTDMKGLFA